MPSSVIHSMTRSWFGYQVSSSMSEIQGGEGLLEHQDTTKVMTAIEDQNGRLADTHVRGK